MQNNKTVSVSLLSAGSVSATDDVILPMIVQSVNAIHHGIFILDASYQAIFHNAYLLSLLGKTSDEIIGKTLIEILAPSFTATDNALKKWLSIDTQSNPLELKFSHPVYQTMWIGLTLRPIYDQQEHLTHTICIASNITSRKMQESLQYKAFNAIAKDAPVTDIMSIMCQEVRQVMPDIIPAIYHFSQSQTIIPISGPAIPDLVEKTVHHFLSNTENNKNNLVVMQAMTFHDLQQHVSWHQEQASWLQAGLQSCWISPIFSVENKVIGALIFYCRHQISPDTFHQHFLSLIPSICALVLEREQSRSQIHQLAYYDALTGLANRSLLKLKAAEAIQTAKQNQSPLALVFIDLDRFKQVNDSLGHHAGDELLRTIANRLQNEAGPNDIVCRLSGDEFVIVFTHCDRNQITHIAKRILMSLMKPCHIKGVAITPSASLGISMFPDNGNSIDILLNRADMAMYLVKKKLHGSFGFFSEEMNTQAQEKMAIENALRQSIVNKEFTLFYQPQLTFKDKTLYGVEALARWNNPQWGHIPTDRFIAIAEECGFIQEFSHWLLEEACQQIARWRQQNILMPVAINLSASNFHNTELAQFIIDLLKKYRLSASDLILEITETVLMDTNPDTTHNISTLHAHQIQLCIDDFGTGYSSLSYLRQLPVSILKLDKSFISDFNDKTTISPLVNAIIRIGESLHLTVIAEGIETDLQFVKLNELGCDVGQGYLFSSPLPADQLTAWIQNNLPPIQTS